MLLHNSDGCSASLKQHIFPVSSCCYIHHHNYWRNELSCKSTTTAIPLSEETSKKGGNNL